jgi:hypothetical protein
MNDLIDVLSFSMASIKLKSNEKKLIETGNKPTIETEIKSNNREQDATTFENLTSKQSSKIDKNDLKSSIAEFCNKRNKINRKNKSEYRINTVELTNMIELIFGNMQSQPSLPIYTTWSLFSASLRFFNGSLTYLYWQRC